jgi:hypothetical protein
MFLNATVKGSKRFDRKRPKRIYVPSPGGYRLAAVRASILEVGQVKKFHQSGSSRRDSLSPHPGCQNA